MKRTTVKISEELDTKLRHIAAQRKGTLSAVIREALELYSGPLLAAADRKDPNFARCADL